MYKLSRAVIILKREYDNCCETGVPIAGFFAIRSRGVNPGLGTATI